MRFLSNNESKDIGVKEASIMCNSFFMYLHFICLIKIEYVDPS